MHLDEIVELASLVVGVGLDHLGKQDFLVAASGGHDQLLAILQGLLLNLLDFGGINVHSVFVDQFGQLGRSHAQVLAIAVVQLLGMVEAHEFVHELGVVAAPVLLVQSQHGQVPILNRQSFPPVQMMGELVGVQVGLLVEPLGAVGVGTDEWFLACVDAHVGLEVEVQREPLVAEFADVVLLPCVHQHVSLQLGIVQEPLLAARVGALEQFVPMHGVVLLQRGSVVKYFAASWKRTPEYFVLLLRSPISSASSA